MTDEELAQFLGDEPPYFATYKQYIDWLRKPIESGSNTMAKAILELEMPESCWQCPCIQDRTETYRWCGVVGGDCPNPPYEKRRDDCPLKPVEDKEVE